MDRAVCDQAERRRGWVAGWLLAGAVLAVLGQAVRFEFLCWDDNLHVTQNPGLNPVTWQSLGRFWLAPYEALYIPASYTSFAAQAVVSRALWGRLEPGLFHTTNLLLHLAATGLVWGLARRWVGPAWAAAASAGAFALHPLQVESVAWISEQRGLWSAVGSLAALHCLVRAVDAAAAETPAARRRWAAAGWYAAGTLALALAVLSKPGAVVVPGLAVIALVGWGKVPWRRALAWVSPWLVLVAVGVALTTLQQRRETLEFAPPSLAGRLLVAGDALAFYVQKLVVPRPLVADYARSPDAALAASWTRWAWLVPLATVAVLAALPGRRQALAAAAWFVLAVLPVLGLVPFRYQMYSTVADRYVYLALVGPALALGALVASMERNGVGRHASRAWGLRAGVLGLLSAWAVLSSAQAGVWQDNHTLFTHTLAHQPRSFMAHTNLGNELALSGRNDEAWTHYERALALAPQSARIHNNAGMLLARRSDDARAAEHFARAIELDPSLPDPHANLGRVRRRAGRLDEALRLFDRAAALDPRYVPTLVDKGECLIALGRAGEAAPVLAQAVVLDPNSVAAWVNLGAAMSRLGERQRAIECFERALALDPAEETARRNLLLLHGSGGS